MANNSDDAVFDGVAKQVGLTKGVPPTVKQAEAQPRTTFDGRFIYDDIFEMAAAPRHLVRSRLAHRRKPTLPTAAAKPAASRIPLP